MIYVVFCENQDSTTGIDFTGIFDNMQEAINWARSEGPEFKVCQTQFGPIEWQKFSPLPEIDWNGDKL